MNKEKYEFYWFIKGYLYGILKTNENTNIVFTLQKIGGNFLSEDIWWYAYEGEQKNIGFNKVGYPKWAFSGVRIYDDGNIEII